MTQPLVMPGDPEFGPFVSESRAGWAPRIALSIIALIFTAIIVLIGATQDNLVLAVFAGIAGSSSVVLICVQQAAIRVMLFAHGIERRGMLGSKRIGWNRLDSCTLTFVDTTAVAAGATGGLLGMLLAKLITSALNKKKSLRPQAFVLKSGDGTSITVAKALKGFDELADSLVPYLTDVLFARFKLAFDQGAELLFGPVRLQRGPGLSFRGTFGGSTSLPLAEVQSIIVERVQLAFYKRGQASPFRTVPANAVPNIGVLQRLVSSSPY